MNRYTVEIEDADFEEFMQKHYPKASVKKTSIEGSVEGNVYNNGTWNGVPRIVCFWDHGGHVVTLYDDPDFQYMCKVFGVPLVEFRGVIE
jgi:hypothetical protein